MVFVLKDEAVAGAAAGVVGTILGFPLDCIKTRMQTTNSSFVSSTSMILKERGIIGFYSGVAAPSLTILNTLNFSSYSYFSAQLYKNQTKKDITWRTPFAAAMVGPFSAAISTPFELVKTQMQLNAGMTTVSTPTITTTQIASRNTNSSIGLAYNLIKKHGFGSLYRGHAVNSVRELVFLATYFTVYENIKLTLMANTDAQGQRWSLPPTIAIAVAGGVSGATGWLVSFPLDLIKSNIQGLPFTPQGAFSGDRKSAYRIGRELLQSRGFLGLYSGTNCSMNTQFSLLMCLYRSCTLAAARIHRVVLPFHGVRDGTEGYAKPRWGNRRTVILSFYQCAKNAKCNASVTQSVTQQLCMVICINLSCYYIYFAKSKNLYNPAVSTTFEALTVLLSPPPLLISR